MNANDDILVPLRSLGAGRLQHALPIAIALTLAVFVAASAWDWRLPGLYMDAVNPEYIIPGILDPAAPGNRPWILPGNALAERFPVFTGTYYHGSTQLYFALPFLAVLGVDVASLRVVQGVVGCVILVLILLLARPSGQGNKHVLAAAATALVAFDPSFVMALRTQAYSCLFPLMLLLASVLLLRDWRQSPRRVRCLFLSGILFGLSVFSYFVFAFFLPALLWMLLRKPAEKKRDRTRVYVAAWIAACAIGYAPFVYGMVLIAQRLDGIGALMDWIRNSGHQLHVMGADAGVIDRIRSVFIDVRSVMTGKWPWLMILTHHNGNVMGSVRAGLLIALPIVALAGTRLASPADRRAIWLPLSLALSFFAVACIFGERLDGHHYTAIVPLVYAAFGCACAALWPQRETSDQGVASARRAGGSGVAMRSLVVLGILTVAGGNVLSLVRFHRDLRSTGGTGFYSDAIDRFSLDVLNNNQDATVYLPDWGFVMPFMFLTQARVAHRDSVDPNLIHQQVCSGNPQLAVFAGITNAAKIELIANLAKQPPPIVTTWSQLDNQPVFQSAYFAARSECANPARRRSADDPAHQGISASWIDVEPKSAYSCSFLSPLIASIRWDASKDAAARTEVWITPLGREPQPWTGGASRGHDETGQWATPGMKFTLIDSTTKRHLAETEIVAQACPTG
jgi:hypothetical protein